MISVCGLIISMVLVPCTSQPIFPESLPLPPLQMYYHPQVQPQPNREQQAQSIPYHLSSVYTFPVPNPIMLFQPVIPTYPSLPNEPKTLPPELERSESSQNPSLTQRESPPPIDITTNTSTFLDQHDPEDADIDSYPIPVNIIPNQEGSTYPMQLRIPILPISPLNLMTGPNYVAFPRVPDPRPPVVMMPTQFNIYNPVPLPADLIVSVTASPIHDLKTLIGPNPEYPDTESTTPVTEAPDHSTEVPVPEDTIPLTETPLITSAPEIESPKLNYSSLSTYFNSINPYTYASSYSNYIPITKFEHNITAEEYQVKFETGNGIKSEEEGHLVKLANDSRSTNDSGRDYKTGWPFNSGIVHVKSGKVSWTSPECNFFTLTYVADENGYRPEITESPDKGCTVYKTVNNDISDSASPSS